MIKHCNDMSRQPGSLLHVPLLQGVPFPIGGMLSNFEPAGQCSISVRRGPSEPSVHDPVFEPVILRSGCLWPAAAVEVVICYKVRKTDLDCESLRCPVFGTSNRSRPLLPLWPQVAKQ